MVLKKCLFSIIIPVYNAQNTIVKLLDSVREQSSHNYEVIIIIDGATDDSGKVIENYIMQYSLKDTWHYYFQKNLGVSAARNLGLSLATGQYILFCDSDDTIDSGLVESVAQRIKNDANQDDIIFFGKSNMLNGNIVSANTVSNTETMLIDTSIFETLLNSNLLPTTWNKAVRADFIGATRFKDIPAGEDYEFYLDLLEKKPYISIMDKSLYNYDIGSENSIMHRYHPERTLTFIHQKEKINHLLLLLHANEEVSIRINRENNADCLDRIVTNLFRKGVRVPFSKKYRELKFANKKFPISHKVLGDLSKSKKLKVKLADRINPVKFILLCCLYVAKNSH